MSLTFKSREKCLFELPIHFEEPEWNVFVSWMLLVGQPYSTWSLMWVLMYCWDWGALTAREALVNIEGSEHEWAGIQVLRGFTQFCSGDWMHEQICGLQRERQLPGTKGVRMASDLNWFNLEFFWLCNGEKAICIQ